VRHTTAPDTFQDELQADAGFNDGIRYPRSAKRPATIVAANVGGDIGALCRPTTVMAAAIPGPGWCCAMDVPGHSPGRVESVLEASMQLAVRF
jgi:hypothetical protein